MRWTFQEILVEQVVSCLTEMCLWEPGGRARRNWPRTLMGSQEVGKQRRAQCRSLSHALCHLFLSPLILVSVSERCKRTLSWEGTDMERRKASCAVWGKDNIRGSNVGQFRSGEKGNCLEREWATKVEHVFLSYGWAGLMSKELEYEFRQRTHSI